MTSDLAGSLHGLAKLDWGDCTLNDRVAGPVSTDERGTHLAFTVRERVVRNLMDEVAPGLNILVDVAGKIGQWKVSSSSAPATSTARASRDVYSATFDAFESVFAALHFTPRSAERINSCELEKPPIFVQAADPVPEHVSRRHGHEGLDTVRWIQEFLQTTQEKAIRVSRVAVPTFFAWKRNPASRVRGATIADALRVQATLERATKVLGSEEILLRIHAGRPSMLDRLLSEDDSVWREGLDEIATWGDRGQDKKRRPIRRSGKAGQALARFAELERLPGADEDGGARQVPPDEVRRDEGNGRF